MCEVALSVAQMVPRAKYQERLSFASINSQIDKMREWNMASELAHVACFSEFHFHRIFGAVSGETLNNFTSRLRIEKAARLLRYSDQSLTDIALD
jgi:AraC family transcriptional regulator